MREGSRKTFLPVPLAASAAAAGAAPTSLDSPAFAALDPFTYLVTFDTPAAVPAPPAPAGAAAAPEYDEGDLKSDVDMKEAAGAAAAAASCGVEAGKGLPVVEVCEAELRQPAPDEVLVMVQVGPHRAGRGGGRAW